MPLPPAFPGAPNDRLGVGFESNAGWAFADRGQGAKVERVDVDEISIVVADQRCVVPDRERGDDQIVALRRCAERMAYRPRLYLQLVSERLSFVVEIHVVEGIQNSAHRDSKLLGGRAAGLERRQAGFDFVHDDDGDARSTVIALLGGNEHKVGGAQRVCLRGNDAEDVRVDEVVESGWFSAPGAVCATSHRHSFSAS